MVVDQDVFAVRPVRTMLIADAVATKGSRLLWMRMYGTVVSWKQC